MASTYEGETKTVALLFMLFHSSEGFLLFLLLICWLSSAANAITFTKIFGAVAVGLCVVTGFLDVLQMYTVANKS